MPMTSRRFRLAFLFALALGGAVQAAPCDENKKLAPDDKTCVYVGVFTRLVDFPDVYVFWDGAKFLFFRKVQAPVPFHFENRMEPIDAPEGMNAAPR